MKNQLKTTKPKSKKERRHIDWGRYLFTGFLCVTMMAGSATQVFAAPTVWEKATEIMKDVYNQVLLAVMPKPLRKYRKIKIMDDNGNESTMLLGKQSKVKIGYRYRFYFKETQRLSLGSEYLDSAMSSDCFLGYEELGEFSAETTE